MLEKIFVACIGNYGALCISAYVYRHRGRPAEKNNKPLCRKYFL